MSGDVEIASRIAAEDMPRAPWLSVWSPEATEFLRHQLRCEARWWTPHLMRFAAVLVLYAGWWIATQVGRSTGGRELLVACATLQSVVICLLVPLVMEQRLGVVRSVELWSLLRMTPLRSWEWLIGCFAGPWLGAVIHLLMMIPVVMFAITLGGISSWVIPALLSWWATVLVLVTGLSALSATTVVKPKKGSTLGGEVIGLLWFYNFGVWGIGSAIWLGGSWLQIPIATTVGDWLVKSSPFQRGESILSRGSAPPLFESYQLLHIGVGLLGLWTALRVNWRQTPSVKGEPTLDDSPTPLVPFQAKCPKSVARCTDQPLYWKDFHFIMGGKQDVTNLQIGTVLVAMLLMFGGYRLAGDPSIIILPIATGALAIILDFAWATRLFQRELKDQTWASLRLLPCSTRDHVHNKLWAHWRTVPPRLLVIGVAAALSATTMPWETATAVGVIALVWPPLTMMMFMGAGRSMTEFGWRDWLVGFIHVALLIVAGIGIALLAIHVGTWAAWLLAFLTSAAFTAGCYYETFRWLDDYSIP